MAASSKSDPWVTNFNELYTTRVLATNRRWFTRPLSAERVPGLLEISPHVGFLVVDPEVFTTLYGGIDTAASPIKFLDALVKFIEVAPAPPDRTPSDEFVGMHSRFVRRITYLVEYIKNGTAAFAQMLWYRPLSFKQFYNMLLAVSYLGDKAFSEYSEADPLHAHPHSLWDLGGLDRYVSPNEVSVVEFARWVHDPSAAPCKQLIGAYIEFNKWVTQLFPGGDIVVRQDGLRWVYSDLHLSGYVSRADKLPLFTSKSVGRLTRQGVALSSIWYHSTSNWRANSLNLKSIYPGSVVDVVRGVIPGIDFEPMATLYSENDWAASSTWMDLGKLKTAQVVILARVYQRLHGSRGTVGRHMESLIPHIYHVTRNDPDLRRKLSRTSSLQSVLDSAQTTIWNITNLDKDAVSSDSEAYTELAALYTLTMLFESRG